jgi:hypothetical protein
MESVYQSFVSKVKGQTKINLSKIEKLQKLSKCFENQEKNKITLKKKA